jgi:hypothetical protein
LVFSLLSSRLETIWSFNKWEKEKLLVCVQSMHREVGEAHALWTARLSSSVAKQSFSWRHWKRLTETFMIARGLSTFAWWCGSSKLFYSPCPFLSLLIGKTKVSSHLFYTLKLIINFFIALYLIFLIFFWLIFFFNLVPYHLVLFSFYIKFSHQSFKCYLFLYFLFLVEFCFQYHLLAFDFNLFLCQIWLMFLLLLFVLF